ncbi:hypothetical protein [Coleofasciculus sp. E2-BRE-01]|jgi:hypothetical protein|uniref:hypothetical protein n=1 Tax=unclassified Coleofasciculus TaxID=2692782 RepID=UPI0032F963CB
MNRKHSELLLKTLEVSTFVVTLYTYSAFVGIAAAGLAIYCLLQQAREEDG